MLPIWHEELYVDDDMGATWVVKTDVNDDGRQDFVIYTNSLLSWSSDFSNPPFALTRIYVQGAEGNFSESTENYVEGNVSPLMGVSLSLGDLNRDGKLDFILAGSGWDPYLDGKPTSPEGWEIGEPDLFFLSNNQNRWTVSSTSARPWTHDVAVGDINADGFDDVFSASIAPVGDYNSFFSVFRDGNEFELSQSNLPSEISVPFRNVVDLESPSFTDMNVVESYSAKEYTGAVIFDADGDHYSDLVLLPVGETKNGIVYFNDGKGNFDQSRVNDLPSGIYGPGGIVLTDDGLFGKGTIQLEGRAGDVDRDGDLDLIILSTNSNTDPADYRYYNGSAVEILKNDGKGNFSVFQQLQLIPKDAPNYTFHSAIELIDINRDGHIDIVVQGTNLNAQYPETEILQNDNGRFVKVTESYLGGADKAARYFPFHDSGSLHFLKHEFSGSYSEVEKVNLGNLKLTNLKTSNSIGFTIAGHAESEHLVGSSQSDVFLMSGGSDVINGLGGTDILDVPARIGEADMDKKTEYLEVAAGGRITAAQSIERIEFTDVNVALDLDGSAGQTAKVLAAVVGEDGLSNKEYVGIGLSLFDAGQSLAKVCELALNAVGATTNEDVVTTLYTNLYGESPSDDQLQEYVELLDQGVFTKGSLAAAAAELTDDLGVIDLVGLAETGIEYV